MIHIFDFIDKYLEPGMNSVMDCINNIKLIAYVNNLLLLTIYL